MSVKHEKANSYQLGTLIRANGLGSIDHKDEKFPRNVTFDESSGDLFSAFHDLQFGVDMAGCIRSSRGKYIFDGSVRTRYHDWWGFSNIDAERQDVSGRQPFSHALIDALVGEWYQPPDWVFERLNMQEYRFVALQDRDWVRAFTVEGEHFEEDVTIETTGADYVGGLLVLW